MTRFLIQLTILFILATLSLKWILLAPFNLCFILLLALSIPDNLKKVWVYVLLVTMIFMTSFALLKFVKGEAFEGIVQGSERALVKSTVSKLREIVFAQDIARQRGYIDPDLDKIGSALTLDGLRGKKLRNGKQGAKLLLRFEQVMHAEIPNKIAKQMLKTQKIFQRDGYLYAIFLPLKSANLVDEEKAERHFIVYAWPSEENTNTEVLYLDEHERIYITDNKGANQSYKGLTSVPNYNAALSNDSWDSHPESIGMDGGLWKTWKGKKARKYLVGESK